jgi:hypothetical protein
MRLHWDPSAQQQVRSDKDKKNDGDDSVHGEEGAVQLAQIVF